MFYLFSGMAINKNHVDCNYYLGTATLSSVTVAPSVWVKSNAREDERVLFISLSKPDTFDATASLKNCFVNGHYPCYCRCPPNKYDGPTVALNFGLKYFYFGNKQVEFSLK